MKTTVEKLKMYAPEYADETDERLQMFIDDAYGAVIQDGIVKSQRDKANRLLACANLWASDRAADGGVQQATMLGESQTMFAATDANNPYLGLYNDVVSRYGHSQKRGWARSYG